MRSRGLHRITSELIKARATCQTVNKSALKKMRPGRFWCSGTAATRFVSLLGSLDAKKEQMSALFLFILGMKCRFPELGALFQRG